MAVLNQYVVTDADVGQRGVIDDVGAAARRSSKRPGNDSLRIIDPRLNS
jgi:hypothetical protein